MTLHAFDTTVNRIPGTDITVTVPIYSTEPGTVTATASGCTFPDGNGKVIAGTRTWFMGSRSGNYVARASVGQDREDVTWFFEIDASRIKNTSTTSAPNTDYEPMIGSFRQDLLNRANWYLFCWRNPNGFNAGMMDSIDTGTAPFHFINATALVWTNNNKIRYALTKAAGGSVKFYTAARATVTSATRNSTGTMGGSEVLAINAGPLVQCTKILRVADNAELDAWFSAGTIPATNQEFSYLGTHEVDSASPVIYDASANNYDLTALQITNWQAPKFFGDYTDAPGDPVVPASSIRVTIPAGVASPVTLTLTRPRQGVPSRATDGEKYETASGVITLVDPATRIKVGPRQIYGVYL